MLHNCNNESKFKKRNKVVNLDFTLYTIPKPFLQLQMACILMFLVLLSQLNSFLILLIVIRDVGFAVFNSCVFIGKKPLKVFYIQLNRVKACLFCKKFDICLFLYF